MKYLAQALFIFCSFYACTAQVDTTTVVEDTKPDRNMFGHGIPRGLTVNQPGVTPGYLLFFEPNGPHAYLLNREGELVHQWKGNYGIDNGYLMEDGSLVCAAQDPDFPVFAGGGEYGRIQKYSWEGKRLWDFEYATEDYHAHHDIAVMPNGNILAIAWESKTADEAIANGRRPEKTPQAGIWPEHIVEIKPRGKSHGDIVWEWHLWDHIIQDFDSTKLNYGDPGAHPELIDINLGHKIPPQITEDSMDILHAKGGQWRNRTAFNRGSDVFHFNAINYNADLDQITVSSPELCEIFIIDHSTTTSEAASHQGGRAGRGGDLLYRWGNPQNYQRGDSIDQRLYYQHDVRWIEEGKPGAGNLTLYNNNIPGGPDNMNYSSVLELKTPLQTDGTYAIGDGVSYGPPDPTWTYVAPDTLSFWSSFISGAHRMKNGNTMVTEGARSRFFEVTPDGETIWEYLNQHRGNIHKPNGDPNPPMPMTFSMFRTTFVPADFPAFVGKKLVPLDPQPAPFVMPPAATDEEELDH